MSQQQYQVIRDFLCIKMPKEIDHHHAETISRRADQFICQEKVNNIIFDFEETDFMDSSGIGIIAGRYKKVQVFGGKIYVVNAGVQVKRILSLSGLQQYIIWMKKDRKKNAEGRSQVTWKREEN
ncbi:MAG: anti-sigma factor antagonist [Lachnospiraceae bacterium]|nr:anti-sigma factor antagonist [Lachnospiraceae bacterium]